MPDAVDILLFYCPNVLKVEPIALALFLCVSLLNALILELAPPSRVQLLVYCCLRRLAIVHLLCNLLKINVVHENNKLKYNLRLNSH